MSNGVYVELEGKEELRRAFLRLERSALGEARAVTRASAEELEREAKARIPVRLDRPLREPRPGATRDSVRIIYRDGGISASIGSGYMVARYLEHGTKHMSARRWMAPAWAIVRPKFLEALRRAVGGLKP